MDQLPQSPTRSRFTFIDLLLVSIIIVLVLALIFTLMANISTTRHPGNYCKNNMKQIGTAIKVYESQSHSLPYIEQRNFTWPGGSQLAVNVSVFYQLLSCIDAGDVANLACYYAPAGTQSAAQTKISAFQCPVDPSAGTSATSRQGPGGSTICPIAMSNYVLNYSIFRGNATTKLTSSQAMEEQSSTIIMGERLEFCGLDSTGNPIPQVWWADPLRSTFWVAGADNRTEGIPDTPTPPGMAVQTGARPKTCVMPPQPGASMPSGTYFQSSHPAQVNVLRGDAGVTQITSGFDMPSLNYWCLGKGRDKWKPVINPLIPLP